MYEQPEYPTIKFLLRHGKLLPAAVASGLFLLITALAVLNVVPLWSVVLAAVGSLVLWVLLRSYIEILAVMADTLLPK